jgi:hypothetical protein
MTFSPEREQQIRAMQEEIAHLQSELARERRERDEAVERAQQRLDKAIAATLARKEAQAKVHAIEQVRVWRNEDGKGFLFADDVRTALGCPTEAAVQPVRNCYTDDGYRSSLTESPKRPCDRTKPHPAHSHLFQRASWRCPGVTAAVVPTAGEANQ